MHIQSLNGNWQVRQQNFDEWLPACVPGGIHTDLLSAGRIPDPFQGENEKNVQWVAEKNWVYRRFFYPTRAILEHERISLVCDGLDTMAEVRLNGRILGAADNAFRRWEWEIHHLLRDGENVLEILFRSPLAYIRGRERMRSLGDLRMGIPGGAYLRKPASHFGWDWGPQLPCMGIWRDIRLEGYSQARLVDIRLDQEHENVQDPVEGLVTITARVQADSWGRSGESLILHMLVTAPDGSIRRARMPLQAFSILPLKIYKPQLWWPNGLGTQPLYQVRIELLDGEPGVEGTRVIDSRQFELGLRTIALRQEADAWGRSFSFVVNDVPVFCKGANWIPADSFPARVSVEKLESLIRGAAETHQNMLRVWGGGYYEDDRFYELCDRYGILVWQDFMFACYAYPLDDTAYLDSLRCEVVDNVRRLRHHACLALWCGNNEIETLSTALRWARKHPSLAAAHEQVFYHMLPELVASEDPARPYWPGSPASGAPFHHTNGSDSGDGHLWDVFHAFRPASHYRKQNHRFVSEFGMQSLPAMETLAAVSLAKEGAPADEIYRPAFRAHQRAVGGNPKLIWYLAQRFRLPQTLEGLVYLSQVFQAEVIRTGVEHWRRQPAQTGGALYWQLNDCWPVISWSSVDYSGRWKALQYAARRFFAPVLLSIEDITHHGQRKMNVWLSNDLPTAWEGRLFWTLETLDGEFIEGGDQKVQAGPVTAECVLKKDFTGARTRSRKKVDWRKTVFTAELWSPLTVDGETRITLQTACFAAEKHLYLEDPDLQADVEILDDRLQITIHARKLARFVKVHLEGTDARFRDNFFDLPAGRTVTVDCPLPPGWSLEQARSALRVQSLGSYGPMLSHVQTGFKAALAFIQAIAALSEYVTGRK